MILNHYDLFIFDFDGTIADTLPLCFDSFRAVFAKFNNENMENEDIENWFGPSEIGIIENNLKNQENRAEAIQLYYTNYESQHSKLVKSKLEIIDMLNTLKKNNKKIALVTGKGRKSLEISKEQLNLSRFFDFEIASEDVKAPKPHPEGILNVINHFNTPKKRTVYIGDSEADILAAKYAGIDSIGVQWFLEKEFSNSPTYISKAPNDLFSI